MSSVHPNREAKKKPDAEASGSDGDRKDVSKKSVASRNELTRQDRLPTTSPRMSRSPLTTQTSTTSPRNTLRTQGSSAGLGANSVRKISHGKLSADESCTTIALGNETYTIVASRKSSTTRNPNQEGSSASSGATSLGSDKSQEGFTDSNGETIRIFRRSRTHRPPSTTRADSFATVGSLGATSSFSSSEMTDTSSVSTVVPQSKDDTSVGSDEAAMPAPDSPAGIKEAYLKLKQLLSGLKDSTIDTETLVSNLEYVTEVVQSVATRTEDETEDDLSELQSEAVPEEVRKWLASTFAKQDAPPRRSSDERPSFKSVANAIRTGIFIERIYRRMATQQLMVVPHEVQKALKLSNDWSFDTFAFTGYCKGSPLRFMGYELLTRHGCLHKYKIPPIVLETMLVHIEQGYAANGNPYHNNMHACDVLQTVHYFISQTGFETWLSDLEIFTCLLAAIIHDFDHSGTTNNFHINSGSDLAILYNDRSVLENHHVSKFFRIIQDKDCNIFLNMSRTDFRDFRNLLIDMVLHTDMSQHFSQLKAMKTLVQQHNGESHACKQWRKLKHGRLIAYPGPYRTREVDFDKAKVLCLLLHSCDVSHPAKPWEIHYQWTSRCLEEFFRQGDREAEMGLEYSPLCDRHNTMVPQSQIGFIDFIVNPTLNILGDVLEIILKSLENKNNKKQNGNETESMASDESKPLLRRPWVDILAANKAKWQDRHDAGLQGIDPSGAENDLRPQSVTSITGSSSSTSTTRGVSRPTSSTSSTTSSTNSKTEANVFASARGTLSHHLSQDHQSSSQPQQQQQPQRRFSTEAAVPRRSEATTSLLQRQSSEKKIVFESDPPSKETRLQDILDDLPEHVLSRTGTPESWSFEEKSTGLSAKPPRPSSASMCSPPMPRKVPISVDHRIRKDITQAA